MCSIHRMPLDQPPTRPPQTPPRSRQETAAVFHPHPIVADQRAWAPNTESEATTAKTTMVSYTSAMLPN